jgi:hypothetical protein
MICVWTRQAIHATPVLSNVQASLFRVRSCAELSHPRRSETSLYIHSIGEHVTTHFPVASIMFCDFLRKSPKMSLTLNHVSFNACSRGSARHLPGPLRKQMVYIIEHVFARKTCAPAVIMCWKTMHVSKRCITAGWQGPRSGKRWMSSHFPSNLSSVDWAPIATCSCIRVHTFSGRLLNALDTSFSTHSCMVPFGTKYWIPLVSSPDIFFSNGYITR